MSRKILVGLLYVAALTNSHRAFAAPTPSFPTLVYGNESVAVTDDASGFLINPAAGGIRYPEEMVLSLTDFEPGGRAYRGVMSHGRFGVGGIVQEGGPRSWTAAMQGGEDRMRAGFATTWLRGYGGVDRATDYRLGLLARSTPLLSVGVVADHLFQHRYAGQTLGRTYQVGVSLRPLAGSRQSAQSLGPRLTLSADVLMAEAATRRQARLRFGGEFEFVRGLILRGSLEDRGGFHLGIAVLGVRTAYHGSAAFDGDRDRLSTSHSISIHAGEDRTIFAARALRRVMVARVGGTLGDDALDGFTVLGGSESTTPAQPLHDALERAVEDPLTRGVLLDLRGVSNMAQLEELRPRIARLRSAGKPVVAYMEDGGGRGDLFLATACDKIVASEEALFMGLGLRAERRYYRRLLADWGVRFDRSSYGKYKSAYRNFSADSTPPPDREATNRNLDVSQDLFVSTVTADRHMDRARLLTLLDGRQWPAADLQKAGLIDSVGYREDALRVLGRLSGLGRKPRTMSLARQPEARRAWTVPGRIAVVYASGAIETGRSGGDLLMGPYMGSATVIRQLERAFKDPEVEAVVLRVESPGGSGLASNLIDHAVQRLKQETKKPCIVSMGSVAGSGGYYIAAHGDRIFADRFTRTGSIGVLTIKPSLEGWYARHRVREDDFERGRYMRGTSLARDWDPEIQASADSSIQAYYRGFVAKVADGRRLSWAHVDSVAQGRVWMGEDALRCRLVDEIGGLEAAVSEARRRARIPAGEKIRLVEFRRPRPSLLARLAGGPIMEFWARTFHLPEPGAIYYLADDDGEE